MAPKAPYHHGDLRRALLEASLGCIEEAGPEALTLREVARRAGVSHAAPYRHFPDKQALLGAVAEAGFHALAAAVGRAAARAPDARSALVEAGVAYVEFARRHPAHFEVMFRGARSHDGTARVASNVAFEGVAALVTACQDEGVLPEEEGEDLARAAWAMVHGIAELALTGRLQLRGPKAVARFTRRAAGALLDGLAAEGAA